VQLVVAASTYLREGTLQMPQSVIKHVLISAAIIGLLIGCGGGAGGSSDDSNGAKNVTVSWIAPDENTDGSQLVDLVGYRIYYGTSPGSYSDPIEIDNIPGGLYSYVVEGLGEATWYFVMTAINDQGIESSFSEEVSLRVTTS
jgi:hypothetical protein